MRVSVNYVDGDGVDVSFTMDHITKIEADGEKLVAVQESGAKLTTEGTGFYVECEEE